MLAEPWRYEQLFETSLTPEETAAAAYGLYVAYLSSECNDMACCPLRINPFNGRLQQSDDGGLTWFDVPDGPWTESLYPPFSAMPLPRPEATADEKKCAAAATAAYVIGNLYEQTGNTLLNAVATTDWDYAGALGSMLTGFLAVIGAVATQPYVALSVLLGIVGVKQQYVDNPLDTDDTERLTCILLDNSTVEATGAVTFSFQAVWDAVDLVSPKQTLVRFLLTMIGPDALNYAGAVDAGLTPDCDACICADEWGANGNYNFEADGQQGWHFDPVTPVGSWSGLNWATAAWPSGPSCEIEKEGALGYASSVTVYVRACQTTSITVVARRNGTTVYTGVGSQSANGCAISGPKVFSFPESLCIDQVDVLIKTASVGNGAISRITVA